MSAAPRSGIVASRLGGDGYPVLSDTGGIGTESLSYLFDGTSHDGKQAFTDVGDLLQVDADGYYYYDSMANFAQFDEGSNDFTLYDTWGVRKSGNSPDGQFFPFNTGSQVFDEGPRGLQQKTGVTSKNAIINHYFGVHMDTRFIQQDGGYTGSGGNRQEVTYNFSGDDDVWVFIDDVLVGDLGGIHDRTSLEINFHDGHVYVYDDTNTNNRWDPGEWRYQDTTIAELMRKGKAGAADGLNGNTFEDGTYHTLDFFYLERGNSDSNMSLKYNLVVPPETDIVKVDQDGEGVKDAEFKVYVANANYETQGAEVCIATTGADGSVVLLDAQGMPITFDQLWTQYSNSHSAPNDDSTGGGERINLVLSETKVPAGYRSTGDIHMYLWHKNSEDVQGQDDVNLLLADMSTGDQSGGVTGTTWQTGAYAQPTVQVTAPDRLTWEGGSVDTDKTQEDNGRLFAIVEKKNVNGTWVPVYGNQQNGWTVADNANMTAVRAADDATQASFMLASSGSFQALIDGLPGRIQDYVFFHTDGGGEYRGAYFYTTAGTGEMTAANTHRVTNTSEFGRQFAAHLYVPNIINRVIVQKTDDEGKPVNDAEFTMYASADEEGTAPDYNKPVGAPVTTKHLTLADDKIDLDGAAVFTHLNTGIYWIVETAAPAGYAINKTPSKVIVTDNGVYADAGEAGDGIEVTRGVGRIVRSIVQFATDDDIDATLHHIVATPQIRDTDSWKDVENAEKLHLHYAGDDNVLDYGVETPTTADNRRFTVDTGIPYLRVQQCNEVTAGDNAHDETEPRVFNLDNTDISNLFTGVTIVQVTDQRVGSLKISKTVTGDNAPTDATFTFNITLKNGDNPVSGTFTAGVYGTGDQHVDGSTILNITFDEQGQASVELQGGQYVVIEGLPVGTEYTVTEAASTGYTPSNTVNGTASDNGSIANGFIKDHDTQPRQIGDQVGSLGWVPNQTVAYKNEYAPQVTASFTIAKQIEGRDWLPDDTFSFLVGMSEGNGDAVTMPTDDNGAVLGTREHPVVIKNGTSDHKTTYGDITFIEKGTYRFTVTEVHGDAEGMTYSGAEFTVTVDVENLTSDPTVTVARTNGTDVDGKVNDGTDTVTFINHFGRVSVIPLNGGDSTARSLLLAGGGVLLVAGAAWLLARRRRV